MTASVTDRNGILAGGTWIVDRVKMIDVFPQPETLSNIYDESRGTGGSPYNVLINLSKLGVDFPLEAAGLVGADDLGKEIRRHCKEQDIKTRQLTIGKNSATSYTDVMTEQESGRRTFFHFRGANDEWTGKDLDFERITTRIFHLGYLLLMGALDQPDPEYQTQAAALLARAQSAGIKTSIDVVSEDSDRFPDIVTPALAYSDYCILNEYEAGRTTQLELRDDKDHIVPSLVERAAVILLNAGVREIVVIHFREGAYARTKKGVSYWKPSLRLPVDYVQGSAGAGDAFCAGILLGLHEGWDLTRSLLVGHCAAAASLSHPTCTGGMLSLDNCLGLARKFPKRTLPKR